LRAAINTLAEPNYPGQPPNALDYVVLFLPAESLFSAALERDRDCVLWAAKRRILPAAPASQQGQSFFRVGGILALAFSLLAGALLRAGAELTPSPVAAWPSCSPR
jgi:hypothetical protein